MKSINADPKLHGTEGPLHVSYGGHQSNCKFYFYFCTFRIWADNLLVGREFTAAVNETTDIPFTEDLQDFKTGRELFFFMLSNSSIRFIDSLF